MRDTMMPTANDFEYDSERERFWLVWRGGGGVPTHMHPTKDSAEREAERLAKANPGSTFYVMKAVAAAVADEAPVRWPKMVPIQIPF